MFVVRLYPKGLSPLMTNAAIVKRLKKLRQSFEEIGGDPEDSMPFALLLDDVCREIGLTPAERQKVLGHRGVSYLHEWGETPVRLVENEASAPACG